MEILRVTVLFVCGAIVANWLVIFCLAQAKLEGQRSCVSPDRKLWLGRTPQLLFAVGLIGGLVAALLCPLFTSIQEGLLPIAIVNGVFVGTVVPCYILMKINDRYLRRAQLNLESGDFQGAVEDAQEIQRSTERYRHKGKFIEALGWAGLGKHVKAERLLNELGYGKERIAGILHSQEGQEVDEESINDEHLAHSL